MLTDPMPSRDLLPVMIVEWCIDQLKVSIEQFVRREMDELYRAEIQGRSTELIEIPHEPLTAEYVVATHEQRTQLALPDHVKSAVTEPDTRSAVETSGLYA